MPKSATADLDAPRNDDSPNGAARYTHRMSRERHGFGWLPLLRGIGAIKPARGPIARSPAPQVLAVEAGGEVYDIIVRRHRRARRYTLRIHATRREAILSMPMRGN